MLMTKYAAIVCPREETLPSHHRIRLDASKWRVTSILPVTISLPSGERHGVSEHDGPNPENGAPASPHGLKETRLYPRRSVRCSWKAGSSLLCAAPSLMIFRYRSEGCA